MANASLALAYLETGRKDKGQAYLDMALKLNGKLPFVQKIKARFQAQEGNRDEIKTILQELRRLLAPLDQ